MREVPATAFSPMSIAHAIVVSPSAATEVAAIAGLSELWARTLGDPRVCVAVLDGPVDLAHTCLRDANVGVVETLVCNNADDGAASQHGTHVASVIFAQHDGPIKGIAPRCRGLVAPIFT